MLSPKKTKAPASGVAGALQKERNQASSVAGSEPDKQAGFIGRCSIFTSLTGPVGKSFTLDGDKLTKETLGQVYRSKVEESTWNSVDDLAELLNAVGHDQALTCSTLKPGTLAGVGLVVTQAALSKTPGAVARTKDYFAQPDGPGLLYLDFDPPKGGPGLAAADLWALLVGVMPELAGAAAVGLASGSSFIYKATGEEMQGQRGTHLYVQVANAADGPRVLKVLAQRLWLAGHGYVAVSKSGAALPRCPVDLAVADPCRLIFIGGAICGDGLEQRRPPAEVVSRGEGSGWLDTSTIKNLNKTEEDLFKEAQRKAIADKADEISAGRVTWLNAEKARRVPDLVKTGASYEAAGQRIEQALAAAYRGVLLGDFELTVVRDDGQRINVTVAEVLRDRAKWNESDVLDPLNPGHRGGASDGRLFLLGASPICFSFDDGGVTYKLRAQKQRIEFVKGDRKQLVQGVAQAVADLPNVFFLGGVPVVLAEGRTLELTPDRLMNLTDENITLYERRGASEVKAKDLSQDVAKLVLTYFVEQRKEEV